MTIRYTGDGTEFHNGIPMRDLTDADIAVLTPEQRELVNASALYDTPEALPVEDAPDPAANATQPAGADTTPIPASELTPPESAPEAAPDTAAPADQRVSILT